MKIKFWSSTEYSGFLAGLMRELTEAGFGARQCYQISESDYRSAKSTPARLFLRFRQYVVYPAQLIVALSMQRVRVDRSSCKFKEETVVPQGKSVQVDSSSDESEPGTGTTTPSLNSNCNDVCVVSTNTFYAPLIATYLHPHVVHLVYDLFPEAMIHSGKWTEGTFKVKIVRWITQQTLKRAKTNVFLGERLKDYVESIHGPVANAAIIAVGADQSLFRLSPKQRLMCEAAPSDTASPSEAAPSDTASPSEAAPSGSESDHPDLKEGSCESDSLKTTTAHSGPKVLPVSASDKSTITITAHSGPKVLPVSASDKSTITTTAHSGPKVLYCGNFGNMHDSATLFEYWRQRGSDTPVAFSQDGEKRQECRFYFSCSGPKRAAVETERAQLPAALQQQIQLGGGLSQEDWITTMKAADVALVTMVPGSETVVMPSKTYSAMMAGQAILAIAPEDSDLVDLIKAADCGWFVEPGDVVGLAKVIEAICSDSEGVLQKRENAFQYAHAHLGQDALAKDWARALRAEA